MDMMRSGNMVGVPGDEKNTFNIMEMSGVDDNFFKMMNIPIVQGSFFTERNDSCRQVIIDERGAEKLIKTWHWKDGVVGKQITCTGHDENKSFTDLWRVQEYSLGCMWKPMEME